MYKVRREIKDGQLVKEAFDPNGIESFGHVQGQRTCQSPLAEIPGYSFNEAGQLQGRAMAGWMFSQAQAVSFYTVCRVGESSVIGQQHRPTHQAEALRRAAASVMKLFGGGPEKGRT